MRTLAIISALALIVASPAMASTISSTPYYESEGNNTIALADVVGAFVAPGGAFLADGCITPGDVDYYAFSVPGLTHLVAAVYAIPTSETIGGADSLLALYTGAAVQLEFDDDDNIGFMSSLETDPDIAGGTYYLAVSGFGDSNFDGIGHSEDFCYKLIVGVNTVPEPATIALLAGGLLIGLRRRVR